MASGEEFLSSLSPNLQILVNVAIFVGVTLVAVWGRMRGAKSETQNEVKEIAVSGVAALTDMNPVRDLVKAMNTLVEQQKRSSDAMEQMAESVGEYLLDLKQEREIERRVKEQLRQGRD